MATKTRETGAVGQYHEQGARLRTLRHEHGLSLGTVAAKTGLDKRHLSRIERGLLRFNPQRTAALAKVFGEEAQRIAADGQRVLPLDFRATLAIYRRKDVEKDVVESLRALGLKPGRAMVWQLPGGVAILPAAMVPA